MICGALALVMGSMTSLMTALPEIGRSTGATQSDLTWIIDGYTVTFAGLLLPCGALGDRYGRRRTLIAGLTIFGGSCLLAPLGNDPGVLIVARAFAGLGAALVMPATLSLITTTMRGTAQDRAVGLWASIATLGGSAGLIFGGLVLACADWSAILYVSGAAALLMATAGVLVEESADPARPRFDTLGGLTGAAAIGVAVLGINEAPSHGWASEMVLGCLLSGVALAVVFAFVELRRQHPLLDVRIFRSPHVLIGSLLLVALFAVLYGYFFLVMQYLQLIEAMSPLGAGILILPCAITLFPLALLAPTLVGRYGLRWVTALAMLPLIGSMLLMAGVGPGDKVTCVIALLLMGATYGLCITPATVAIVRSVPRGKQGVASAVNDAAREVGAALGIAVVGSLLAAGYARNVGPAVAALPQPARGTAEASLAGALHVSEQLGPLAGPALTEAREAFLSGMHMAFFACAIFIALCALTVAVAAPGAEVDEDGA